MRATFTQHRTAALHPAHRSVRVCIVGLFALIATVLRAAETGFDWPQFRGPRRDGVSRETGLLKSWPPDGPALIWKRDGIGRGYSCPAVKGDTLYITGDVGEDLIVAAFDLAGTPRWRVSNGKSWKKAYPGARATCTLEGGRLYHMNAHGRAVCLNPDDGSEVWSVPVLERFQAQTIRWGISECLLIDGDRVIVSPGGEKALMAALDKKTGGTVWSTEPLHFQRTHQFGGKPVDPPEPDTDKAGYASPMLIETGGRRMIAGCSARHVFCVDADAGKLLWTQPVFARYEVIGAVPVLHGDSVFFTAPDQFGGRLFRITADAESVRLEQAWETAVDNCHGALVLVDGHLYGSGYRRLNAWVCLDVETGATRYTTTDWTKGSVTYADGRLYALSEDGLVSLLEPADEGFQVRGQFHLRDSGAGPPGKGKARKDVWAHPVVCNGRLYLRDHDTLFCFDIRGQ